MCFLFLTVFLILLQIIEPSTPFLPPGYVEITEPPLGSIGALDRCGQGEDAGKRICVPYYLCNATTNTIIQDGSGLLDLKLRLCDKTLDVCCKIPPASTTPTKPSLNECGIRKANKDTGKSDEAGFGEFPWMVAIMEKTYKKSVPPVVTCGGSLIAPGVVLTGAHCLQRHKTDQLKVRAGEWDIETDKEPLPHQERDISDFIIHNKFNPHNLFNDAALIVLKKPFNLTEHIGNICLPKLAEDIDIKNCLTTGWGNDMFGQKNHLRSILKKIEVPLVSHNMCEEYLRQTRLGKFFELDQTFLCAGGKSGRDPCTGDGGSPLMCPDLKNPGRYTQIGIVAWGIGCGEENVPGVYANVSQFSDWIKENVQKLGFN